MISETNEAEIIHPKWLIEENLKIFFNAIWFIPPSILIILFKIIVIIIK